MKRLMLAVVTMFVGCGNDGANLEPQFEFVDCAADWQKPAGAQCQRGCEHYKPGPLAGGCLSGHINYGSGPEPYACTAGSFEWEGLEGCCNNTNTAVYFVQCDE